MAPSPMKRPRAASTPFTPTRRTEVFEGQERLDEIHDRYSAGCLVDGEFVESCTWSVENGALRGIVVFVKVRPATY